jgi:hypothetical protein
LSHVQDALKKAEGLPFADLLPPELVDEEVAREDRAFRDRVFSPVMTLWTFLWQVLSPDHSCTDAVARVLAWRVARGEKPCSADSSSYCQARLRLPLGVIQRLVRWTGRRTEQRAKPEWLWKRRHPVKIADGTTMTMADTEQNQAAFPQREHQVNGVGFPIARMVAIFSLACGTALELVLGPTLGKKTGEETLFRSMLDVFEPGDVLLGDRLFDSYRNIAELQTRGVHVVFRQNASRKTDFRRGRWLGTLDHVVAWRKPRFNAQRFDRETYDALPDQMEMRELHYRVEQPGFRTKEVTLVTTLLDPEEYTAEELADLYRQRWHCELDLNALKTTLQMEHLRCKTPEMVEKEVWTHFLAYNLMRQIMAEAACEHDELPRQLSFKGAVQTFNAFVPFLILLPDLQDRLWTALLQAIARHRVGDRPDRVEPRKLKRRPGKYPYMTRPRKQERERLYG